MKNEIKKGLQFFRLSKLAKYVIIKKENHYYWYIFVIYANGLKNIKAFILKEDMPKIFTFKSKLFFKLEDYGL